MYDNPWTDRVLRVLADESEKTERKQYLGITLREIYAALDVQPRTDDAMGVDDAINRLTSRGLAVPEHRYIRLATAGWGAAGRDIPGSDDDEAFLEAVIATWRDPQVRRPFGGWINDTLVLARLGGREDYHVLNVKRRLVEENLLEVPQDIGSRTLLKPTFQALQLFPEDVV